MEKILVVYKYSQVKQAITKELEQEGYEICSIEVDSIDFEALDPSDFNLTVITPYNDVSSTWEMFVDFKEHFPEIPAIAYIGQQGVEHLKLAIKNVLSK